jgi:serine/threonine-protein kinase
VDEERTTEIRREPPPPWYQEHWWIFLVALLLIVGGIIAFFALRDDGDEERQRVLVPNVVGLREQEARAVLEERGLAVEVTREASDRPEAVVFDQDPAAGSRVERGAGVSLRVSTGPPQTQTETETVTTQTTPPETVTMPDVRGEEHDDAAEDLVDLDLLPETYPIESQEERGNVVEQEPGPGTEVQRGSVVRLDVSLGSGEREELEVLDLVGLGPAQALEECARAGFTCRLVAGGEPERPVTSQRPAAGTAAPELSQIRLSQG